MKTKKELIEILEKKAKRIDDNYKTRNICDFAPWNNKEPYLLTEYNETEFKLVHSVCNSNKYYYYISNLGRVIVVNTDKVDPCIKDNKLNKDNCWFIPIENGYLNTFDLDENFPKIKISTSTYVYNFMIEAGWLENSKDDQKAKELAQKIVNYNKDNEYPNDRLEVHHIDNNPSNNSVKNLIWLPKSIHQTLH